ncbi:tRNA (guanosine(18)-2'-O)-methyltransferase TrmH [Ectothiorhodospiraceae bacterium WFHF3C12]|nr:tRNA (guanosine(18)-2'-O)-methyltransferase TrmH [Ectothiorhodospiraceae bacterium WFHF3C12]
MTAQRLARLRATLDRRQPDLRVMLDQVHKPHNLSAILRSCDAVGAFRAHAVTARGRVSAHRHSSAGAGQWVDIVTHPTLEDAIASVHAEGFRVYAAHLSEQAVDYRDIDYTEPTVLLMGAELWGVSDTGKALADGHVMVPMFGLTESLNVSVATAVMLFEAQKQRLAAGMYDAPRLDADTYRRTLFEWMQPRVAAYCRRHGLDYPALDEDGHVVWEALRR